MHMVKFYVDNGTTFFMLNKDERKFTNEISIPRSIQIFKCTFIVHSMNELRKRQAHSFERRTNSYYYNKSFEDNKSRTHDRLLLEY